MQDTLDAKTRLVERTKQKMGKVEEGSSAYIDLQVKLARREKALKDLRDSMWDEILGGFFVKLQE